MDSLGGTRKQLMQVYVRIMDSVAQEKKYAMTGQLTLFDFVGEEEKKAYEIRMPDVGEYDKEQLLAFEKEVLGIYVSGHPLDDYEALWRKNITAVTSDFVWEETGGAKAQDNSYAVIGGMITAKTVKYTRTNKAMAFLTVEDLVGSVEVIVFPKDYEKFRDLLTEDAKVFIRGRVTGEEEKDSKLVCEKIWSFSDIPRELWIQFADRESFDREESKLYDFLREEEGKDRVVIYVRNPKSIKRLSENWGITASGELIGRLEGYFGKENVKVVEKSIEKQGKMN